MKRIHILKCLIAVLVIELGVIAVGITLDTALAEAAYTGSAPVLSAEELFTERDLEQTPDLSKALYYTVTDGTDIHITEKGVYVIRGTAKNVTVFVEAADDSKVQLVLDGVNITTANFPCIYVKTGDKVTTGQSLGTVDTIGGETVLHFEIWNDHTVPRDPETWLRPR